MKSVEKADANCLAFGRPSSSESFSCGVNAGKLVKLFSSSKPNSGVADGSIRSRWSRLRVKRIELVLRIIFASSAGTTAYRPLLVRGNSVNGTSAYPSLHSFGAFCRRCDDGFGPGFGGNSLCCRCITTDGCLQPAFGLANCKLRILRPLERIDSLRCVRSAALFAGVLFVVDAEQLGLVKNSLCWQNAGFV